MLLQYTHWELLIVLCINGDYIGQWCTSWMYEMCNSCKTCSVNILSVIWYWYRLSDIVVHI